jgi:hypothetical protein
MTTAFPSVPMMVKHRAPVEHRVDEHPCGFELRAAAGSLASRAFLKAAGVA